MLNINKICGLILACGMVAATGASAGEKELVWTDEGDITFATPSGNIGCHFIPAGGTSVYEPRNGGPELQCDRVEPSYVSVILGPTGPVTRIDNPGEQGCCSLEQTLGYGDTWRRGPFSCTSARTGLTCSRRDGPGFSLSRSKVTVK